MADERPRVDHHKPPFSRVFVVCSRSHTEEDLRSAFEEYGEVEDVWVVKRKDTKEPKGIAYVKFTKASEAALAMEKLHGSTIGDNPKPIKALLADTKTNRDKTADPISQLAMSDDKHRTRIFILVSKTMTDSELTLEFSQFGKVDHVQILKDKTTMENKGCAYVRFCKPSEAFNALENCDKTYKAVIAEPRVPKNMMTNTQADNSSGPCYARVMCPVPTGYRDMTEPGATTRLTITCHTSLTEQQLTRLFDIVPGLKNLDLATSLHGQSKGMAFATYMSVSSASYARNKLNNIEYPPGFRLGVSYKQEPRMQPAFHQPVAQPVEQGYNQGYSVNYGTSGIYDGMQQVQQPQQQQPQQQGVYDYSGGFQTAAPVSTCPYTDVALPPHQPISSTTHCRAKLFFVAAPQPISEDILSDIFCRFSELVDIQIIPGTAYGYIRYAMKESANAAKMLLDGATIAGSTIRLSFAEDNGDSKRAKIDH